MLRFIVLLLPFVALVSGQEKVWAELGDAISIKCPVEAKENIFGCDWVSPNGTEVDIRKIDLEFKSRDERLR